MKRKKSIEKYCLIPPWVMDKQHLTLWTLYHAKNTNSEEKITPEINIDEKGEIYEIIVKIIRLQGGKNG